MDSFMATFLLTIGLTASPVAPALGQAEAVPAPAASISAQKVHMLRMPKSSTTDVVTSKAVIPDSTNP